MAYGSLSSSTSSIELLPQANYVDLANMLHLNKKRRFFFLLNWPKMKEQGLISCVIRCMSGRETMLRIAGRTIGRR